MKAVADAQKIKGRYQTIEHTADIGIVVESESIEELFALSACAMFDLMIDLSTVRSDRKAEINLEADSLDELFITWLNELIYRAEVSGMLFGRFEVNSITDNAVQGVARGEPYNEKGHVVERQIKAATYHELKISHSTKGWQAQVIFDV